MAKGVIKQNLAKIDLERVLAIAEVFDHLKPGRPYKLYEIATTGKACVKGDYYDLLTSLTVVNYKLNLLDKVGTEKTKDGFHYLYAKRKSSEEIRADIRDYADAHFKEPLANLKKPNNKRLDEFLV